MGQKVSSTIARASRSIGASNSVGGGSASEVSRAAAAVARRSNENKFTDPNAVVGGFQRGQGGPKVTPGDIRDEEQQEFLRRRAQRPGVGVRAPSSLSTGQENDAGNPEAAPEMPPELIKFLTDVGPLQKRGEDDKEPHPSTESVAEELSNQKKTRKKRQPKVAVDEERNRRMEQEQVHSHQDSSRRRESMRLARGVEGFETERTTSFSRKKDLQDPNEFCLQNGVLGLYRFLTTTDGETNDHIKRFYDDWLKERQREIENLGSPSDGLFDLNHEENQKLLQNALEHLEVPVIMQDTDGSYVGVPASKVPDLKLLKLREVPKTSVKLVLEDLGGDQVRQSGTQ